MPAKTASKPKPSATAMRMDDVRGKAALQTLDPDIFRANTLVLQVQATK
jgi:hypothetical protein